MHRLLGEEYNAFAASYEEPRTFGLRVNRLKTDPQVIAARLGIPYEPVPWNPDGLYYPASVRPGLHPYYHAGVYYIQEPSAMAPAPVLAPRPGDRVLDLAAAPGGKTTNLGALMENRGLLVANDIRVDRAGTLVENLERNGVTCAVVLAEKPERLAERFPSFFDRILVDAPCSGEGMFRKMPEMCKVWRPGMPDTCARVQVRLLECAVTMLRPGGRLLYSTCTFAPQENEEVLLQLLIRNPSMRLVPITALPGAQPARPDWTSEPDRAASLGIDRAVRLWPHRLRGEGHFVALLEKEEGAAEDAPPAGPSPGRRRAGGPKPQGWAPADRDSLKAMAEFCRTYLTGEAADRLLSGETAQYGEWLYRPPEGSGTLAGLRVLRSGLQLGRARKARFEPAHALALALRREDVRQVRDLRSDSPEVLSYLQGEPLPAAGEQGWTLIAVDGFPLGWAKAAGGVLKNHYPRGLLWRGATPPTLGEEN